MVSFVFITAGILSILCTGLAYAGAAYIYEMGNPSDTGYAGAGLAARANDAGTVFTNPAGMTRFKESTYLAGVTPLYIDASFNSDQNTTATGPDKGVDEFLSGGSFAAIFPVAERLTLGVSVQNYFGLALEWDDEWVGRYESTEVVLLAPQMQPTVAYKVNDWLSIGAGVGLTLGILADEGRVNNLDPDLGDGKFKYDDTDFAVQGNLGVMIEPSDKTRIGFRYLTETDLDFEDNIYVSDVGPAIANSITSVGQLDLGMKMPQSLMVGAFHQLNDNWAILGSVGWDDWSSFGKVRVKVTALGAERIVDEGFDDTWHFGIGTEYRYTPKLTLTGGFSYDSGMADSGTRPITLPLGDMYRYGLGFKYQKSDTLLLGGGLSFLWEGDLDVKPAGGPLTGVSGKYENVSITFLSFYVQW